MPATPVILLAEDDQEIAFLMSHELNRATGYEVSHALDGASALDRLQETPLPVFLVTDLQMPGMDGFELIERVRAMPKLKDLPIVVLSASEDPAHAARCERLGVPFLKKSLPILQLRERFRDLFHSKVMRNEAPEAGEPDEKIEDTSEASHQQSLRILVVENHPDTLTALQLYLEDLGHTVFTASGVADALNQLPSLHCDVLISDIGLPDGTGWDLLQRAGPMPHTFAIAMSGFGMNADSDRSRQAGFRHHLLKPFKPEELDRILQEAAATSEVSHAG